MTIRRAVAGVALIVVVWAQSHALTYQTQSVPAGGLVELSTDSPALWVPQRPLTLELKSYEIVTGEDGRAYVAVFVALGREGDRIVVDAYSNGPRYPIFVRHVVTIGGGDVPGPTPDPIPDPDDPLPDTQYNVGPAIARVYAGLAPADYQTVIGIFDTAANSAGRQSATVPNIVAEIHTQMVALQTSTGGAIGGPYETYKTVFNAAAKAGKLATIADYAAAYREIVEWLRKGG